MNKTTISDLLLDATLDYVIALLENKKSINIKEK